MKLGLLASLLVHLGGLAILPGRDPVVAPHANETAATSCRCDYEMTITDGRPPRAVTLGEVPAHRFTH